MDKTHTAWNYLCQFPTYLLLRLFCVECSFEEVISRCYIDDSPPIPDLQHSRYPSELLKVADEIRSESDKRRGVVIDKCKTLLTLSGLLLPLLLAVSTQIRWPILFLIPATCVFITSFLVLVVLGIGTTKSLSILETQVCMNGDELWKAFAHACLETARYNDERTDYLVDVMRAARRSLICGLFTLWLVIMFGVTFLGKPDIRKSERGPAGEQGVAGEKGPPGSKGPVGDKGPTGDKGQTGDKGDMGPAGARGPTGEKGLKGDDGSKGEGK